MTSRQTHTQPCYFSGIPSFRKQLLRGLLFFVLGILVGSGHGVLWAQGEAAPQVAGLAASDRDLGNTFERLNRFEHVTRVLYITAHPDDENGPLLAYLSRGLGAEVALLTITRGEGGQNLMSTDQGSALGLVRTEELLAADREYGVEQQFFTRVIDFGYTTNAQETLSRWGDAALADMVRVIRTYRPDVVLSRWTGTVLDGHGHHQAAGMLARHAVVAAADANEYPDQLGRETVSKESGLRPWRAPLFFMEVSEPASDTVALPVESFSTIREKSYWQIGRAGYANHRTQYTRATLEKVMRAAPPAPVYVRFADENQPQPQITDFAERLDSLPSHYAFLEQKPEVPAATGVAVLSAAERLQAIHQSIDRIRGLMLEGKAEDALRALAEIRGHLEVLAKDPVLDRLEPADAARLRPIYERKLSELDTIAAEMAGLEVEAYAESPAVAGQDVLVRVVVRANPEAHIGLAKTAAAGGAFSLRLPRAWQGRVLSGGQPRPGPAGGRGEKEAAAAAADVGAAVFSVTVPPDAVGASLLRFSDAVYEVADSGQAIRVRPQGVEAVVRLAAGGTTWEAPPEPVLAARSQWAISAQEFLQPVPPFLLRLRDRMVIRHGSEEARESRRIVIPVVVQSFCDPAAAGCRNPRLGVEAPEGWIVSSGRKISFARAGDTALGQLIVVPPRGLAPGNYSVRCFVESEGKRYDAASSFYGYGNSGKPRSPRLWRARYGHRGKQTYLHTADVTLRVMNLDVPEGLRIGYIAGPNDPVPAALERVGVTVDRLDETALAFEDTAASRSLPTQAGSGMRYDALVIGIRALELRPDVLSRSGRWLEYLNEGGVLVVEYQTPEFWNDAQRGELVPFPAAMDPKLPVRITDPKAPVRLVLPNHPLLSQPNRLSADDFQGWVSERGLSFLSRFDAQYQAPLAFLDTTGTEAKGGLVYARVGKGIFIYSGISFFRQLPAAVPGAYRLFINLISQGRYPRS